jgi:cytochrome c556
MNRLYVLTGVLAAAVVLAGTSAQARYQGDFDISAFMKKAHGKTGFRAKATQAVKEKDWAEATKITKDWFADAQKFIKATPPKGDKAAFAKVATNYCKAVKALNEASEKKDAKQANAALKTIGGACGTCHKAHKGS